MDKQIVANLDPVFEAADEGYVRGRNDFAGKAGHFGQLGAGIGHGIQRIGQEHLAAAKAQEVAHYLFLFERTKEHLLVVAHQNPHGPLLLPRTGQADYASAVGSSIDQVTQQDYCGLGCSPRGIIRVNSIHKCRKQVCATMDVANRIDTLPDRNCGKGGLRGCLE
jgi:hypothetical protein